MREIGLMARYEYLRHVRRKSFLWLALGVPIMLVLVTRLIILVSSGPPAERRLGFVDISGQFRADPAIAQITVQRFADEAAARAAFTAHSVDAVIIVTPGYHNDGQVRVIAARPLSSQTRDSVRDGLSAALVAQLDPDVQGRFQNSMNLTLRTVGSQRQISAQNFLLFVLPYILAVLFVMTSFTTSGYLIQALADEKEDRVMEILATTLRPHQMMAGKILGLSGVGLSQVTVWVLCALAGLLSSPTARELAGGLQLPWGTLGLALLFFVLGYLMVAGLYATIGAAVTNPQEGQQFAAPISLLIVSPLWLILLLLAQPNGALAVIMSIIPVTAPITMLIRLPVADIPWWQMLLSLASLGLTAGLLVLASARVMRVGMLRYGKRLSLAEMFSSLRASSES